MLPTSTASIAAGALRKHVFTLADDQMEGRGPDTKGIHEAAAYLENTLLATGLAPLFGQRYRQPFKMTVAIEVVGTPKMSAGSKRLKFGSDFVALPVSATGTVSSGVVFAGFGVSAPDLEYDDYAGIDVKDKVVVVLSGEPGDDDNKSPFDGRRSTKHSALRNKTLLAREAGARALLIIRTKLNDKKRFEPVSEAGLVTMAISASAAKKILGFDPLAVKKSIDAKYKPASRVTKRVVSIDVELERKIQTTENIGASYLVEGATEAIVIGAHYDHLGYGGSSSLSGTDEPRIHNGADDNASGTAVVLEVAKAIADAKPSLRRSIHFILFSGEEAGLLGSNFLVKNAPVPMETVSAMVNLDMVGRLRSNKLNVMGTRTATDWEPFVESVVQRYGLTGSFGGDGYGPSDHTSFYAAGVPVLFLFTGAHTNYHKPTDDPDTLSYQGMAKIAAVAHDLVVGMANAESRPTYVSIAPPAPPSGGGRGYGPYFGSIPDFAESTTGVLLAGVREGSPADRAGVKKGDVLIEFDGITVNNLQDFTVALQRAAPGDEVTAKVRRGQEVLTVKAKLTKRGE